MTYAVAADAVTDRTTIGRITRKMLTPQACSATNSRSADSRPSPIRMPRRSAIGIVMPNACGTSVSRTRVAILWHMHQPFYEALVTGEHVLPWVRLHALKDYYGMAAILREFPDVKVTFNLVPSLLVQLEAFAENRARDRYLELSLKPAANLDDQDIEFILENFFYAQRQRMIDVYPRYAELMARRGGSLPTSGDRRPAAARLSRGALPELHVWRERLAVDPP